MRKILVVTALLIILGSATFLGAQEVQGQASVTRITNLIVKTLTVTGDATVQDDMTITDDLSAGGDATITGALTAGGDATITGALTAGGDATMETWLNLAAQDALTIGAGEVIVPTGSYQPLTAAAAVTTSTTAPITSTGAVAGDILILRNIGTVTNTITIDGTGGTVECKADVVLTAPDTLTLIWNGTAWNCISGYDNS